MNRTALFFGLRTALCMALAITGMFAIADLGDRQQLRRVPAKSRSREAPSRRAGADWRS